MQALFHEVNSLDQACYTHFHLTPDLLMEHAANSIANYIQKHFPPSKKILIVTGSGHNGADGLALARLLHRDYDVSILEHKEQRSELGLLQKKRALSIDVDFISKVEENDIIVDAIFGTGLNRLLDDEALKMVSKMNSVQAFKIAVDLPSGILSDGRCSDAVFNADVTITMGALKSALFSDGAKDFTGEIKVANLGVSRKLYESQTDMFVLEQEDMRLPSRLKSNTHKGSFGHACFISGEKEGASIMAGLAASAFGTGLVTLVREERKELPFELMQSHEIAENATALCLGMGLGEFSDALYHKVLAFEKSLVLDADLFYDEKIVAFLQQDVILTPHPKEFCALLKLLKLADITTKSLQERRLEYVNLFISHYPKVILLLKGAHVIIADKKNIYINPLGRSLLSKGGSGDVLCGLITALLAQGYKSVDAAITASLSHAIAGNRVNKSSYAVTPKDLIESVGHLE